MPSHGGNLQITGPEERDVILNSIDCDDEDNVAYIQWCINFCNSQRSLWDRECFPIKESIMVIKRKEIEGWNCQEHKEEQEVKEEQEFKEEQEQKEEPKA
ncbi:hypothetical protein BT96DRAFT_1004658 [Gymnopus androsaceus JB14]|uniref:Uncharacterized protein n=1 Tax=Gymnopus androsaceus JB14 TaxID=1447944 RepID=A0A6A4GQC2_9AGAR|nr:hypothetical protein BT96DRAFT_1004658 [Gymnopus androsaceus JB14]